MSEPQLASSPQRVPLSSGPLLTIERLGKDFGNFTAVQEVSLTVRRGELKAIIGANGAGKTYNPDAVEKNFMPPADPKVHPVRWRQGG